MVTCDKAVYDKYVKQHPKQAPFINKKIEMALVAGKDMATGYFAKSFADIEAENNIGDAISVDDDSLSNEIQSSSKGSRKRSQSVVELKCDFSELTENLKGCQRPLGRQVIFLMWMNCMLR